MDNNLDSNLQKLSNCSINNCENDVYEGYSECVLHCPKNSYGQDWQWLAPSFYEEFKKYIVDFFSKHSFLIDGRITKEEMKTYLDGEDYNDLEYNNIFKELRLMPTHIVFPDRNSGDYFDYLKILNLFGEIHFSYCEFYIGNLDLKDTKVFFQDCKFHKSWNLLDYKILDNVYNAIYLDCTFNDDVFNDSSVRNNEPYDLNANQFNAYCTFNKNITLYNVHINGLLFNIDKSSQKLETKNINALEIENVVFKNRFMMFKTTIKQINVKNTIFEEKFELLESEINHLKIDNVNFKKIADFFGTKFVKFSITKSIFDDFVGFEQCIFGQEGENKENIATFTYVTFIGFINFRNTQFLSGLDLEAINLKEYPNFLNTNINEKYTNRETFRIIKYSFIKLGNTIESNKFNVKELRKYKEELDSENNSIFNQERLVYFLNKHISDFGQNYFRPIWLLIIVLIIHYSIIKGYESNILYKIYEPLNSDIKMIADFLNDIAKNFIPFKPMMKKGVEFISILFGMIYSTLLWHIIVSIKLYSRKK